MAIAPKLKHPSASSSATKTPAPKPLPSSNRKAPVKAKAPLKMAAPKSVSEKKPKAEKTPVEGKKLSRNGFMTAMVLEGKYTDEEIYEKTVKEYGACRKPAISVARWTLNQALSADKQIERLVSVDGKNVPISKAPAKPKATAKKAVDPDKDPLKKIAGIDVHKKAQAKKKKAA